jgi:thiamine pyrophosphokinase
MHYGIITGGTLHPGKTIKQTLSSIDFFIAADAGAATALSLAINPDIVIGDFDSIDKKTLSILKEKKTTLLRFPKEKNETDTELAVDYAIKRGASKITIFGGIAGDRIDHILANILLPAQYRVPIFYVNADTTLWMTKGPAKETIEGTEKDLLSLIPLSTVTEITTDGLVYPLKNETLFLGKPRGISNVFVNKTATVSFKRGTLIFVHTRCKNENDAV